MTDTFIALLRLVVIFAFATQPAMSAKDDLRSPESVEGAITTTLPDAKKLYDDGAVFIDVRNPRLFAKNHILGAHHLDFKNGFEETAVSALVGKDDPIVIYCSGVKCSRSYRASARAVSWGFIRVHYFRGGIVEWKQAGYPMVSSNEPK